MSELIVAYVSYSPKDNATRRSTFPKRMKAAGPCLEDHSPSLSTTTTLRQNDCVYWFFEHEGDCFVTKVILYFC